MSHEVVDLGGLDILGRIRAVADGNKMLLSASNLAIVLRYLIWLERWIVDPEVPRSSRGRGTIPSRQILALHDRYWVRTTLGEVP